MAMPVKVHAIQADDLNHGGRQEPTVPSTHGVAHCGHTHAVIVINIDNNELCDKRVQWLSAVIPVLGQ